MRVLVACEMSGRVREAFAALGHDAWSCDVKPSMVPGQHLQESIAGVLRRDSTWDIMVAFPPCTYLSNCGNGNESAERRQKKHEAYAFVKFLARQDIPRIAIENPVGVLSRWWRKPDQIVHPFMFGDPYRKRTCLWLKGLPLLKATSDFPYDDAEPWVDSRSYMEGRRGIHRDPVVRSLTFPGVAKAMANQWGGETTW